MRTLSVVKADVIIYGFAIFLLGFEVPAVQFLFLQRREKRLCNGVVMRRAGTRERLDNVVHAEELPKSSGGVLRTLIAVECELLRMISLFERAL